MFAWGKKKQSATDTNSSNVTDSDHAGDSSSQNTPSCCQGKKKERDTAQVREEQVVSIFEFFTSGDTKRSKDGEQRRGMPMLGNCQTVEGGVPACVWAPHSGNGDQHKIVF